MNFHRSGFVRALAGRSALELDEPILSPAERLGQWLGVADAITLFAALNPGTANPGDQRPATPPAAASLREALANLQTTIVTSINGSDMAKLADKARIRVASSTPATTPGVAVDYVAYRRHYAAHQRAMASGIGTLRAKARAVLSGGSPQLRQLAALDAALDRSLMGREHDLLATAPKFLERRFEQLHDEHRQALARTGQTDDPDSWVHPGGWLARFGDDLQDLLLAELELRLQPLAGLIDAYEQEVGRQQ